MRLLFKKIYLYFFLFLFPSTLLAVSSSLLENISQNPQNKHEIIFNFTTPVTYKKFVLFHPDRLVIDFSPASYNIKSHNIISHNIKNNTINPILINHNLINHNFMTYRYGVRKNNTLRIVFDLKKNNFINNNFIIKLTILHPYIIIIDPGHGGKDPGSLNQTSLNQINLLEKNINLTIAQDLEKLINQQPTMKAILTRNQDYYIGLRQRLAIARKNKGNIFMAIHADAFSNPLANGASVYGLSLHGSSSEMALWLAKKENYSELDGIDLNSISPQDTQTRSVLIDLAQTATIQSSLKLGNAILKNLSIITTLHHNTVEQAPFMVLKSPDIPSVLIETGFISNPKEALKLNSKPYQEKIAQAIMKGINDYYKNK